ncbi:MAG: hypothetical protein M1588_04750, partial [Planctomycetes bacterium]|nr:hypothetical protein [Planctomycetota bacterium]
FVAHPQPRLSLDDPGAELDHSLLGSVTHRVVREIDQRLGEPVLQQQPVAPQGSGGMASKFEYRVCPPSVAGNSPLFD